MKTHSTFRHLLQFVIATGILGMSQPLFAEYRIINLGTLGGGSAEAADINDRGQVVGLSQTAAGENHAFLWQRQNDHDFRWKKGAMTDLGTLGGVYSSAADINDRGQVVGTSDTSTGIPSLRKPHAFLWDKNTMKDLGALVSEAGTSVSSATAINKWGQVIGASRLSYFSEVSHAILWDEGTLIDLGTLGGAAAYPTGINARGMVIGVSGKTYLDERSANHAFLWNKGTMIELEFGTLGVNQFASANAINDRGQVAGKSGGGHAFLWRKGRVKDLGTLGGTYSYTVARNNQGQVVGTSDTAVPGESHAFLWDDGEMTDLGTLGGRNSYAVAINARGQVVGNSDTAVPGESHAFLWDEGEMIDLGTLKKDSFSQARAINAQGQVIGISQTDSEVNHAVLWEPGSRFNKHHRELN